MSRIQKCIFSLALFLLVSSFGTARANAFAEFSILPSPPKDGSCATEELVEEGGISRYVKISPVRTIISSLRDSKKFGDFATKNAVNGKSRREVINNLLGCAIKTGNIHLFMVPFFITMLTQFLLSISGVISVLFICLGGFKYAVGGLIEDKESGKKYIQYALLGLVVSLGAWMVVNFIMIVLTS